MTERELLKDKKRIVIKIGSSSLTHAETGDLNLAKIEKLVRVISDMRGMGKEVILVSSGAIATGRQTLGGKKPETVAEKQAYAAVGQARLMMVYQKLFSDDAAFSIFGFCTSLQQLIIFDRSVVKDPRDVSSIYFDEFMAMGKGTTGSDVGTGGMATKLHAAKIATESGADMVIANADDVEVMWRILQGEEIGTLFKANKSSEFALLDYIQSIHA